MKKKLLEYYQAGFGKHGVHENSLGWTKGKQFIRFYQLTKNFELEGANLVDVGCGFGDIHSYFKRHDVKCKAYHGIDVIPEFIQVAKQKWESETTRFTLGNYMDLENLTTDYTIASGIFGHRLFDADADQYQYIEKVLRKAFAESTRAISFDFISDKIDFKSGIMDFHASPSSILDLAYELSRNVILDNSCMPFEFSLTVFKDDSFAKEKTVFNKFVADKKAWIDKGLL